MKVISRPSVKLDVVVPPTASRCQVVKLQVVHHLVQLVHHLVGEELLVLVLFLVQQTAKH